MKHILHGTMARWAFAVLLLAVAAPSQADPYRRLPGPGGASLLRQVSDGWLDSEFDADLDPIYGSGTSAATLSAFGAAQDTPSAAAVLGLPWGEGRWSLAVEGHRRAEGSTTGVLSTSESDLDGDGRPDILRWQAGETAAPAARAAHHLALRTGIRAERFALGLAFARDVLESSPASSEFSYPATFYELPDVVESDDLYDLETGDRLAGRRSTLQAVDRRERMTVGMDFGLLRRSWRAALAVAWQRDAFAEEAESSVADLVAGGERVRRAERDLVTTDDWLRFDLRADRAPVLTGWRWSVGPGARLLLGRSRSGSEALADRTAGLGGGVIEEWVRQRIVGEATGAAFDLVGGLGWVDRTPRRDWALGVDARLDWQHRSDGWEDRLVWRIDDPGIPGQRGASFLSAEGGGFWNEEETRVAGELAATGAARIGVTDRLDLLLGSRLGWEIEQVRRERTLDRTDPLRGQRLTDPGVVDPIELAYGNFTAPARFELDRDAVIADLRVGLALADARFRLGGAMFWRGVDLERVGVEAGVSW